MARELTRWQVIGERVKKTPARLALRWAQVPPRAKVAFVGVVLVTVGAACIYWPAGPLAAGVVCLLDTMLGDRLPARNRRR